jgi:hypothetical protein
MPYNPSVNDNSGQILAGYKTRSAEIKAAGNEALASGIMQGATSAIGGGLGAATGFNTAGMIKDASGNSIPGLEDALNSVKANAVKYQIASGMMDTYKQNSEALGLDMQMLQGIEQKYANKPNELIGALTVVGKIGENNLDIQKAQKTYEALGNAYAGKAAATAAAKAAQPDKMNAETIRSYARDAAAQGATQDQIKAGLLNGFGQWAVDAVFPQPKSNFWGP